MISSGAKAVFADFWELRFATQNCPPFTAQVSQRLGAVVAWSAMRLGLTANQVTLLGLPLVILACCFFVFSGEWKGPVFACLLFQLAYGFDCADGQLARALDQTSDFGAWLDICVDHARNVLVTIMLFWHLLHAMGNHYLVLFVIALYGTGVTVSLHAFAYIKRESAGAKKIVKGGIFREAAKTLTDTPVVWLSFCVFWFFPALLIAYVLVIGALCWATTIVIAQRRIHGTG